MGGYIFKNLIFFWFTELGKRRKGVHILYIWISYLYIIYQKREMVCGESYFYLQQSRQVIERWELLLLGGDYFEVMTLKLILSQGQLFLVEITFIFPLRPVLPP